MPAETVQALAAVPASGQVQDQVQDGLLACRAAQRDGGDLDPILLGRISERGGQELRRVYRPAPYEGTPQHAA